MAKVKTMRSIFTGKYALWLILAIPGIGMTLNFLKGTGEYDMLMHVTGEFAGRFLVVSLIASPLALIFPRTKFTRWLIRNRRFFGVSAFAYTLLHTVFYMLETPLSNAVNEFTHIGMITGWIAFFVFIPLAITSTNSAVKRMGSNWKKLQRWVYLAAIGAFLHWALVDSGQPNWGAALFHFGPVLLLSLYRVWHIFKKKKA